MSNTKSIKQVQLEIASLMAEVKSSDFIGILEENDKGYRQRIYENLQTAHIYLGLLDLDEPRTT